jgi:hypothetical protein
VKVLLLVEALELLASLMLAVFRLLVAQMLSRVA